MFIQRIYNPYENLPILSDNPHYKVPEYTDLMNDMKECFRLYEVSLYLANKVEKSYEQYLLSRELKGTKGTEFLTDFFKK